VSRIVSLCSSPTFGPEWSANRSNPFHPPRGPLAAILPLFSCRFQFPIALGLYLLLMPGEHVHPALEKKECVFDYVGLLRIPFML
jgi:hypothetical protein